MYPRLMAKTLQVRDLSDDVHARLLARARAAGMSLSEYLRRQLTVLAEQPTVDEVFRRAEGLGLSLSREETLRFMDEGRAER